MFKGTLTQTHKSAESGLRTPGKSFPVVYGKEPIRGERFNCAGEGLEFGTRLVSTSPVRFISRGKERLIFTTETGSTYELRRSYDA